MNEVQKWVDPAMFAAEEQTNEGPKVQLLSCTPDPLGTIAAAAHTYQGRFHSSLAEITDDERRFFLADVRKNVLLAPLEFVHFHFRITGVTRGFTHQMVRQRTACYAQESMRFAVKETMPVALPPSLAGTLPWKDWVAKCAGELFPGGLGNLNLQSLQDESENYERVRLVDKYAQEQAKPQQIWRREWDATVKTIGHAYNNLVNSGMPAEDARGLAPTSVLTQLNYTTSLRHLIDHAGLRLCTQAQFEWRLVWVEIIKAIREYGQHQIYQTMPYWQEMHPAQWQFDEIANLFKPICYKTGKCEFMSAGDRFCSIRDRVQANSEIGRPSSEWGESFTERDDIQICSIHDVEWLADPKAARQ
jgi:thymidylate synthase ThyX